MIIAKKVVIAAPLLILLSGAAAADDLWRERLGVWDDPFTLPQTRMRCVKEAKGDWPWGGGWSTCVGHAYDTRKMRCSVTAKVPGPNNIASAAMDGIRTAVNTCAALSVGTAGATFIGTPSPEIAARLGAAAVVLKASFVGCLSGYAPQLSAAGLTAGALDIALDQSCGWTDWSGG